MAAVLARRPLTRPTCPCLGRPGPMVAAACPLSIGAWLFRVFFPAVNSRVGSRVMKAHTCMVGITFLRDGGQPPPRLRITR